MQYHFKNILNLQSKKFYHFVRVSVIKNQSAFGHSVWNKLSKGLSSEAFSHGMPDLRSTEAGLHALATL